MLRFKIVFKEKGRVLTLSFSDRRSFLMYTERCGHTKTGTERFHGARKEVVGEPKFRDLAGPIYDGPGVVRWETMEVYNERLVGPRS